jgi:hypothetical protein
MLASMLLCVDYRSIETRESFPDGCSGTVIQHAFVQVQV